MITNGNNTYYEEIHFKNKSGNGGNINANDVNNDDYEEVIVNNALKSTPSSLIKSRR